MPKNKKKKFIDDGRTISNMNVEGFKWYIPDKEKSKNNDIKKMKITLKERFAIIKATYVAIIPIFLFFLLGFAIIFIILALWLK
jgi:hypothetical protein